MSVCASSNRGSGVRIHVSGEGVGSTLCSPIMEVFFCRKDENSMMGVGGGGGVQTRLSPRTGRMLHADLLQCKWITSISVINVVI